MAEDQKVTFKSGYWKGVSITVVMIGSLWRASLRCLIWLVEVGGVSMVCYHENDAVVETAEPHAGFIQPERVVNI